MDILAFKNSVPSDTTSGQIVNGIDNKLWVERYDKLGEFKFTADLESGIKDILSIGTFVSHLDTREVMIVKDHEITVERGKEPKIVITGVSAEDALSYRAIGFRTTIQGASANVSEDEYIVTSSKVDLLSQMFNKYSSTFVPQTEYRLTNYGWFSYISPTIAWDWYKVERGSLYDKMIEIIQGEGWGLQAGREVFNTHVNATRIVLRLHQGTDRSNSVMFSHLAGEIDKANYFWSDRDEVNFVVVISKWHYSMVQRSGISGSGIRRKMLYVDARYVDEEYQNYADLPALGTPERNAIFTMLREIGNDVVMRHRPTAIANVELNKEGTRYTYRKDYNIGDIVGVAGEFGVTGKKRVTEHVEIEDETGSHSYPTLSDLKEN